MVELRYELEPNVQAPGTARRAIASELSERIDQVSLDSLMLIVSELVTNSVTHGPGKPIHLELEVDREGAIRGEVEDQGDGVVEIRLEANEFGPGWPGPEDRRRPDRTLGRLRGLDPRVVRAAPI